MQPRAQHRRTSSNTRQTIDQLRVNQDVQLTSNRFEQTPYKYSSDSETPTTAVASLRGVMSRRKAKVPRDRGENGRFISNTRVREIPKVEPLVMPSPPPSSDRAPSGDPETSSEDESVYETATPRAEDVFDFELTHPTNPAASPPVNRHPRPGTISPAAPTTAVSLPEDLSTASLSPTPILHRSGTALSPLAHPMSREPPMFQPPLPVPKHTPTSRSSSQSTVAPHSLLPPPTMPRSDVEDLHLAYTRLEKLPDFDRDGKPMKEAAWRVKFLNATDEIDDKSRAKMWASKLEYDGDAYQWYIELKSSDDAAKQAATKDWSRLLPLIEEKWPTLTPDS
ncbi:hypothetical protein FRC11_005318 [Ceratobasidium sp. 423]|nr:hypothetical protein FRC11_005318 [Ceratobasidium sp. 423]